MLWECDMVALCALSHQLIHRLPFCCYFERGINSEWGNDARTDACVWHKKTYVRTPTHTERDIWQSRCSNLPRESHVLAIKKAPHPTTIHFQLSSYFLLTLPSSTVPCGGSTSACFFFKNSLEIKSFSRYFHSNQASQIISQPQSSLFLLLFLHPGWYTVSGLSCWLFPARIITIEESQYGSTDGSFYLVHKYICWLILGPTPLRVN